MGSGAPGETQLQADAVQPRARKAWWIEPLEPYARPELRRSIACLLTSVVPYLALLPAMYYLLDVSYWLVLLVAIPASGFLVRTFIVFHDCGHGSFMPTKRANRVVGVVTGLLVYNPFFAWSHEHAGHHATSGDLERRGVGDIDTWTIDEYRSKPLPVRLGYRAIRSPLIMLTVGPLWALALEPRKLPVRARRRVLKSHLYTDLGLIALVGVFVWLVGWQAFLEIQLPLVVLGGGTGIWLFYVQHQFEDAYWTRPPDWSYADAALKGSSYLRLPRVLEFFTGSIGLHHVHHLNPRIPNYNLRRAHDENEFLHVAPTISLWQGVRSLNLKLIDDRTGRMVSFAQARRLAHDTRRKRGHGTGATVAPAPRAPEA
jgi:acyl-lipid omega-6 desaturase (Delta-12 desaturase)